MDYCQSQRFDARTDSETFGRELFIECGDTVCEHDGYIDLRADYCTKCLEIQEGEKCLDHKHVEHVDTKLNNIKDNVELPGLGVNPNTVTVAGHG